MRMGRYLSRPTKKEMEKCKQICSVLAKGLFFKKPLAVKIWDSWLHRQIISLALSVVQSPCLLCVRPDSFIPKAFTAFPSQHSLLSNLMFQLFPRRCHYYHHQGHFYMLTFFKLSYHLIWLHLPFPHSHTNPSASPVCSTSKYIYLLLTCLSLLLSPWSKSPTFPAQSKRQPPNWSPCFQCILYTAARWYLFKTTSLPWPQVSIHHACPALVFSHHSFVHAAPVKLVTESFLKYTRPTPVTVCVFAAPSTWNTLPPEGYFLATRFSGQMPPPESIALTTQSYMPTHLYSLSRLLPAYFLHNTYCSLKLPCSYIYLFSVPSSSKV